MTEVQPIASTMPISSAMRPVPDGVSELEFAQLLEAGRKRGYLTQEDLVEVLQHCRALPRSDRRCRRWRCAPPASSTSKNRTRIATYAKGPQRISHRSHRRSRAPRRHCTGPPAQKRTAQKIYRNPRARRSGGSVRGHSALTQRAFPQARGYKARRRERSRRTRRETTQAGRQVTRSTRT